MRISVRSGAEPGGASAEQTPREIILKGYIIIIENDFFYLYAHVSERCSILFIALHG